MDFSWLSNLFSSAEEGASAAGSVGSTVGEAASAGSSVADGASAAGQMTPAGYAMNTPSLDSAGTVGQSAGGYDYATLSPEASSNLQTYGTANPDWMDKTGQFLKDFSQGSNNNLGQAWSNRGNLGQSMGYLSSKIPTKGGAPQATPVNLPSNNYQRPRNAYLERYRRY